MPRTLIFLLAGETGTEDEAVLLLRGAAHKRLWAGRYNGLGGHVEAGEDIYAAAQREVWEEAGLAADGLVLRGVVNIDTGADEAGPRPGVLMFVFTGRVAERTVRATAEGTPEWVPVGRIHELPLVDDLHELLPRALHGPFFYGHYSPQPDGSLEYEFR